MKIFLLFAFSPFILADNLELAQESVIYNDPTDLEQKWVGEENQEKELADIKQRIGKLYNSPRKYFRCLNEFGTYPHHNCWQFYQCFNYIPYVESCPKGMQWDQLFEACVQQTDCRRRDDKHPDPHHSTTKAPTTKPKPSDQFKCPKRFGYYKHSNCWQFYQCFNYIPYVGDCAEGMQWDQLFEACVQQTDCRQRDDKHPDPHHSTTKAPTTKPKPSDQFKCPKRFGYYKHSNCWQFYQCSNYIPYAMDCAKGTQWDQQLKTCVQVHQTDCRPRVIDNKK